MGAKLDTPLRFSRLRWMRKSAAHFKAATEASTTAMGIGAAAHSLILGGLPVLCYPGRRAGTAWDDFERCNDGSIVLNSREHAIASGMAASVRVDREAMRYLEGEREQTLTWTNQGVACRGTVDVRNDARRFHAELKTGETADPDDFHWKVRRYGYHAALAWYADGAELAGKPRPDEHKIVAVEATAPFVVTVFNVKPATIDLGRRLVRTWFERLLACLDADQWPGYCQSVVDLDLADDEAREQVFGDVGDVGDEAA